MAAMTSHVLITGGYQTVRNRSWTREPTTWKVKARKEKRERPGKVLSMSIASIHDTEVACAGDPRALTDGIHLVVDALKLNDVQTIYGLVGIPITDLARVAQASGSCAKTDPPTTMKC